MPIREESRAREIGAGIGSVDMANKNASIVTNLLNDATVEFYTAFENLTSSDTYVAVVEDWSKTDMELAIHPIPAKSILPVQGCMAFNIGTSLTDSTGSLSTATYSLTDTSPGAGRYFVLTIYATEDFYLKTLTNCTVINHTKGQSATDYLTKGCHTILFKTTADTTTSVLLGAVDDAGTPSGLAVTGYYVSAETTQTTFWAPNQCRAIK
jgi:hypothetical protein